MGKVKDLIIDIDNVKEEIAIQELKVKAIIAELNQSIKGTDSMPEIAKAVPDNPPGHRPSLQSQIDSIMQMLDGVHETQDNIYQRLKEIDFDRRKIRFRISDIEAKAFGGNPHEKGEEQADG